MGSTIGFIVESMATWPSDRVIWKKMDEMIIFEAVERKVKVNIGSVLAYEVVSEAY
jgi:hypothetical protein